MKTTNGRARLTVRLYTTEAIVLAELEKQGRNISDVVRTALTKYLKDNHEPIY